MILYIQPNEEVRTSVVLPQPRGCRRRCRTFIKLADKRRGAGVLRIALRLNVIG
jgi:hypothetical protein